MGVVITQEISATWRRVALSAALITLPVWPTSLCANSIQSGAVAFGGQATEVRAAVLGITITISDAGQLPATGAAPQSSLPAVGVPGLPTVDVAQSTTVGQAGRARSDASVAKLSLIVGGNSIAADTLRCNAMAVCASRARSPVNASSTPLRAGPHVSLAMRVATLGCCDFLVDYVSAVLTAR